MKFGENWAHIKDLAFWSGPKLEITRSQGGLRNSKVFHSSGGSNPLCSEVWGFSRYRRGKNESVVLHKKSVRTVIPTKFQLIFPGWFLRIVWSFYIDRKRLRNFVPIVNGVGNTCGPLQFKNELQHDGKKQRVPRGKKRGRRDFKRKEARNSLKINTKGCGQCLLDCIVYGSCFFCDCPNLCYVWMQELVSFSTSRRDQRHKDEATTKKKSPGGLLKVFLITWGLKSWFQSQCWPSQSRLRCRSQLCPAPGNKHGCF